VSAARLALRRPGTLRTRFVCVAAALLLAPVLALGQTDLYDLSLVDEAFEVESEQYNGTGIFVERLAETLMGGLAMSGIDPCASCIFSKIEQIATPDGFMFAAYVMSMLEVYEFAGLGMGANMMDALGAGMMLGGSLMGSPFAGLLPAGGPAHMNPITALFAGGQMMHEGADARREAAASLAASNETAQAEANQIGDIRSLLQNTGVEPGPIGPMTCFRADGLGTPMDAGDGQSATMNSAGLCVDNAERVIVKHRIEGTMEAEGELRPFFIEVENSDFRQVSGCDLYKPYRRVNRIGGMLNDAQMAEMQEASQQLAEFEQQMAAMDPAQRAMMEGMMGSQMDMVRNMANGGAMENVIEIEEILCDPDLRALLSPVDPAYELAQIQRDLVTLGYMPGNTDGVLDTLTEVAISQYQAESGLPVTGQPSTDLAFRLSSEASGQG